MRILAVLIVVLYATTASAQPTAQEVTSALAESTDPVGTLVTLMIAAGCNKDNSSGLPEGDDYFIVDVAGTVYQRPDGDVTEGSEVTVHIVGPESALPFATARRISPARDPDVVRYTGEGTNVGDILGPGTRTAAAVRAAVRAALGECRSKSVELDDFAPPEGRVGLDVTYGTAPTRVSEFSFGVRRLYRGAISFGPLVSLLPEVEYSAVVVGDVGVDRDTVLAVDGGDVDNHYAVGFTYYLGGGRTIDAGYRWGVFLAFPVTDPLDNAFAGFTVDIGGGLYLVHAGVRVGRVERLSDDLRLTEGGAVPTGVTLVTREELKPAFAFGVTVGATAAATAFGSVLRGLAGN